jgi:hypothetical protein
MHLHLNNQRGKLGANSNKSIREANISKITQALWEALSWVGVGVSQTLPQTRSFLINKLSISLSEVFGYSFDKFRSDALEA